MKFLLNSIIVLNLVFFSTSLKSNEFKKLEQALGIKVESSHPFEVAGFNKLITNEGIMYVSSDNNYIFTGNLFQIDASAVNLTERHSKLMRRNELNKNVNTAILYQSKHERFIVDVFINVDCYYCRKLHGDIDKYLRQGISIRYYAMPSGNANSDSFKKLNSIWCSKNKQHKVNLAMMGISPKFLDCSSSVTMHQKMVTKFGMSGTPTFILSDGRELVGYRSPNELLTILR